jgi:hypothetical protein
VEDAKFVSGNEGLKDLTEALRSVKYSEKVPDATPVKILRRGTLSCSAGDGECTLVLELPEDVRSVD